VVDSTGGERVIAQHGPGRFLGELNLLTGMRVFLSARVVESGEMLAISREGFRHVVTACPTLSDLILVAFLPSHSAAHRCC
jgi:thioredoxin reductase (NADPH)